jgi:hypothetical protein
MNYRDIYRKCYVVGSREPDGSLGGVIQTFSLTDYMAGSDSSPEQAQARARSAAYQAKDSWENIQVVGDNLGVFYGDGTRCDGVINSAKSNFVRG